MPIEFHRDGPWDLPEGWVWARLGDVSSVPGRIDPARQMDGNFRYIDLSAVEDGKIVRPQSIPVKQAPSRARQPVRTGDSLLSCVRVYLRNNVIVPSELDGAVASTAFCVLRPTQAVDPRFLFWFIHSRKFTEVLVPLQRGNSPPSVLDEDVREQSIPIPPLAEQGRIVARIDELFTEITDGETALTRARDDLDTWRRALLKAAVTGELTREWREQRATNDSAEDLVKEAIRERDDAIKIGNGRRFKVAPPQDDIHLPEIPSEWEWAQLGDFLRDIEAGLNVKAEGRPPKEGETGIVKISAVTWGQFDEEESKALSPGTEVDEHDIIELGDFLFSRANTLELVGAPVIVKTCSKRLVLSDKVLRLRFVADMQEWIEICLKSPLGRSQIEHYASGNQLSMRNLSQENLVRISIPVPPRSEVDETIQLVRSNQETADDGGASISDSARTSIALRQSVLKAAFEGRLVPQDPRDEPAEQLLTRLGDAATPTKSKGRRARAGAAA